MKLCSFFCLVAVAWATTLYKPLDSQSEKQPKDSLDLLGQEKSVRMPPQKKNEKGCCKIKYPTGGYDFFLATESDCRASLYFDRFLGENNSLCLRWEEN